MIEEVESNFPLVVVKKHNGNILLVRSSTVTFEPLFPVGNFDSDGVCGKIKISDMKGNNHIFRFSGYELGLALERLMGDTSIPALVDMLSVDMSPVNDILRNKEVTSGKIIGASELLAFRNQEIGRDGDFYFELEEKSPSCWFLSMVFYDKVRAISDSYTADYAYCA